MIFSKLLFPLPQAISSISLFPVYKFSRVPVFCGHYDFFFKAFSSKGRSQCIPPVIIEATPNVVLAFWCYCTFCFYVRSQHITYWCLTLLPSWFFQVSQCQAQQTEGFMFNSFLEKITSSQAMSPQGTGLGTEHRKHQHSNSQREWEGAVDKSECKTGENSITEAKGRIKKEVCREEDMQRARRRLKKLQGKCHRKQGDVQLHTWGSVAGKPLVGKHHDCDFAYNVTPSTVVPDRGLRHR